MGLVYDLRINRLNKKVDYAVSVGFGKRDFGSVFSPPTVGVENVHLRGTAIFGKSRTSFEAGLQVSHAVLAIYDGSSPEFFLYKTLIAGFPIGFRYQYPHRGFFARAYIMPAFELLPSSSFYPTLTTGISAGYTF